MAAPMTPSRYGSSLHSTQTIQAISMADSLPSVDFGFEDLRERMNSFTARFDDFIAKGRKRVLDERNAFRMSRAETLEAQRHKRQAMTDLEQKSILYANKVDKEMQETQELQESIAKLQQEKARHEVRRQELQLEVQDVQTHMKQRQDAVAAQQQALDTQAEEDIPELQAWESLLGLRIVGAETVTERLRFIFKDIDDNDPSRQAWFEMDFGQGSGVITDSRPKLHRSDISHMEGALGSNRDIAALLKGMRALLVQASKG